MKKGMTQGDNMKASNRKRDWDWDWAATERRARAKWNVIVKGCSRLVRKADWGVENVSLCAAL